MPLRELPAADPPAVQPEFEAPATLGRSAVSQILAQQAAIAEISQHALGERRLEVLLTDTCVMVARILGTELVSVLELSADTRSLKVVAGVGWKPGVVGQWLVPVSTGSMSGFSLASGNAVIVEDMAKESRFDVGPVLADHGAVSGISVRIGEPSRPFGAISAFTGHRGRFTRDDTRFLEAVAGVIASAIARQHAEDELRNSRDELAEILASVSEGISVQNARGQLLFANDAAARLSGFATGADMVAAPNDEILARFELLDHEGGQMPADQLPGRAAMASGRRGPPVLVRFRVKATGEERWSHVQASPILDAEGRVSHVVSVFRDITAEKSAERTQALIAEALGAFGSTLDPDEAARQLAEVLVPKLADFAEVDLLDADGRLMLAALAHVDPRHLELARRYRDLRPPSLDDRTGPAHVVRTAEAETTEISAEMLQASARNPAEAEILAELAPRSYICVPLVARRAAIGALTLVNSDSRPSFTEGDLAIAKELAAHAAVALENAQLFRAANERRAELDAVLASMAEAVLVFDGRKRLLLNNRSAVSLFGEVPATLDELRRRLVAEPSSALTTAGQAEVDAAAGGIGLEGEFKLADTERWLEVHSYPTADGKDGGNRSSFVVVAYDVTSNRFAQTTREAFLGVMSHELRTPITTIYGGSELLTHGLDDERRAEVIRDIRAESGRLVRLVEDLLVMTRVERGVLELGDEPLLLQRVLPALAASLTPSWPMLKIELDIGERLPAVRGDVTYIEQVVRNLINNAIRYGEALEKGITLHVGAAQDEVIVRVLDNGPGLADVDPEQLFDLFFRAPNARVVSGGAGIGLFVCRALVEAMGGRIWARQRDEGGTEFGFALVTIEAD
jgi:signal transduction histidine kinase